MIIRISAQKSEREQKAEEHWNEMAEKYYEARGIGAHNDFRLWYHLSLPDRLGCQKIISQDYPLPYQLHYFQRFAELFFQRHAEHRTNETLEHEFIGDETDEEYLESLLITANQYGFFNPGAIIEFIGTCISCSPPPAPGAYYRFPPTEYQREYYEGSEANKDRAKMIRRWLKKRRKALGVSWAAHRTPPARLLEPAPFSPTTDTTPKVTAALIKALTGHVYLKVSPSDVAALAIQNLLDRKTGIVLTNANLRLYAIAKALDCYSVITLPVPAFAALIGAPFGILAGERFNGAGKRFESLYVPIRAAVLEIRTNAQARERKP